MTIEKHGFIYIWRDKKRNKFYIGCHWGTEDDGYVCSSKWMRDAYRYRSEDFKRRILARVYTNRNDLLQEEYRWLSKIKPEELGKRYYNLTNHPNGHWSASEEDRVLTLREKISKMTKEAMARPEVQAKSETRLAGMRGKKQSSDAVEKRREAMKSTMAKKFPVEQRKVVLEHGSEAYRAAMAESVKKACTEGRRDVEAIAEKNRSAWKNKSPEELAKHAAAVSKLQWWTDGKTNKRVTDSPGEGWTRGRTWQPKATSATSIP